MRVSFVVDSSFLTVELVQEVVGRSPDRSIRIGERVGKSDKISETNFCSYELGDFRTAAQANASMIDFLDAIADRAGALSEAHKYFDLVAEIGSLDGDLSISETLLEKMRSLEVQIDIDITRY